MSSFLKSPGQSPTAPFTSPYGKARTPYQSNTHIPLSHILLGPQKLSASCFQLYKINRLNPLASCKRDLLFRPRDPSCITSLHPQASRIGKSGWQRRTAQLEPNHSQSGAKPKTFPVSAPEHQINNVAIRASRVFEQESGAV